MPPEEAARCAQRYLSEIATQRIRSSARSGEARLGSRTVLRLWGVWFSFARKRLPLIVSWTAEQTDDGSRTAIEMHSDTGWCFVFPPVLQSAYEDRFAELTNEFRGVLSVYDEYSYWNEI